MLSTIHKSIDSKYFGGGDDSVVIRESYMAWGYSKQQFV
jgi:hypothetical protein